jgi:hypothetical protein
MAPLGSVRPWALTLVAAWGWRILVSLRARRGRLDPRGARLTRAGLRPTITGSECMSNYVRGGSGSTGGSCLSSDRGLQAARRGFRQPAMGSRSEVI